MPRERRKDPDPLRYLRITADGEEIARFERFIRLVGEAEAAGCTRREAVQALYPDVYPDKLAKKTAARG